MNLIKIKLSGFLFAIFIIFFHSTSFGQSQIEMNSEAFSQYKKADRELNIIYQKVLKEYSSQVIFIKKFKAAQHLWMQLRDVELEAKYPEHGTYGSVEPICEARFLESLTQERIKFLKVWLNGIEEGEYCNGSVKVKKN